MSDYVFRIRVDRSPRDTINCSEQEISLVEGGDGHRIYLTGKNAGQSLKQTEQYSLFGTGYASESEAKVAGEQYETALLISLAHVRVGADFGYRAAKSIVTHDGLRHLEEVHGERMLNDVHGLMVYARAPRPKFATFHANLLRGANLEKFVQAFKSAAAARSQLDERERLAYSLFNSSFFQPTADSRFLLLVMSVEALIEPADRSAEARSHVDALIAATKSAAIPESERESMLGSLSWLRKESINQAGRHLASTRLAGRAYKGKSAADFFTYVYQLRSSLVHGSIPSPTFEQVSAAAAPLEVFVSELLTCHVLGCATVHN